VTKKGNRRDVKGALCPLNVVKFDDADILGSSNFHTISGIQFFTDGKSKIYGFQAQYFLNGKTFEGHCPVPETLKATATKAPFTLSEGNFIRDITIFYSSAIEQIKIETQRGEVFEVGKRSNSAFESPFKIGWTNIPITLFGGVMEKKNGTFFFIYIFL